MARGKVYIAVGVDERGEQYMAFADCKHCHGRGTVGHNTSTGKDLGCRCLKTTDLPIKFVVLNR